jgi:hypothetical protein
VKVNNKVYITTAEAIDLIRSEFQQKKGPSLPTVIGWVQKYNLGHKFVGRWMIDKEKFMHFLTKGRSSNAPK